MISNLTLYQSPPFGWSRFFLKIVRDDTATAARLWPVPRPGYWENPYGVSYSRVAHLRDLADPAVAAWVSEHQTPGTMVLVSGALGLEPGQVEGAPVLEVLVQDEPGYSQSAMICNETRAEHYQRTGLRPPEQAGR